jgi:hypothetical protein
LRHVTLLIHTIYVGTVSRVLILQEDLYWFVKSWPV